MFETFSGDTTLEIPLTREKSCYKEYKSENIISIIKWNSPFNEKHDFAKNSFHDHKVKFAPQGWVPRNRQKIQKQKQT